MWYAVLPTFVIITSALYLPNMFAYFSNKLLLGQPYRRALKDNQTSYCYLRDAKLSGRLQPHDYKGLENIPDAGNPKI